MALTQAAERAALCKLIDYVDEDPEARIPKIMDAIDRYAPASVFPRSAPRSGPPSTTAATGTSLYSRPSASTPRCARACSRPSSWTRISLRGRCRRRRARSTAATSPGRSCWTPRAPATFRCTGCWAAEYGHALNLSYEDICSIIDQGRELGCQHLHLHGRRAAGAQGRPHPHLRELPRLRLPLLHQRHPHRRGLLPGHDSRGQLRARHLRRGQRAHHRRPPRQRHLRQDRARDGPAARA